MLAVWTWQVSVPRAWCAHDSLMGSDWGCPPGPYHGDRQHRCSAGNSAGWEFGEGLKAAELAGTSKVAWVGASNRA